MRRIYAKPACGILDKSFHVHSSPLKPSKQLSTSCAALRPGLGWRRYRCKFTSKVTPKLQCTSASLLTHTLLHRSVHVGPAVSTTKKACQIMNTTKNMMLIFFDIHGVCTINTATLPQWCACPLGTQTWLNACNFFLLPKMQFGLWYIAADRSFRPWLTLLIAPATCLAWCHTAVLLARWCISQHAGGTVSRWNNGPAEQWAGPPCVTNQCFVSNRNKCQTDLIAPHSILKLSEISFSAAVEWVLSIVQLHKQMFS